MDETNKEKRPILEAIPDFIATQDKQVIHDWKTWRAMGYRIDNHVHRFFTCPVTTSDEPRTFDMKAPIGVLLKSARNHGVSKEDQETIKAWNLEIKDLQGKKGSLSAKWKNKVFKKKKGAQTLLDMRGSEILDMYGRYFSTEEVRRIIQTEWGYSIRPGELTEFAIKNKEKIDKKRADYVLAGKETRLATDAGRMEVLSKIAWEMEQKFDKTKSIEVSKELRAVVEQIRKEVKGDEIRLTVDGKIDITATIQANQTLHEALQKLPINMIVIGLTAAKQGINPAQIIGSLANSYYSKFNGFNKLGNKEEIQLPGQYIKTYNWEEIRIKNEEHIEDVEAIEVYEEKIEPTQKVVIEQQKSRVLDLLKGMKEEID